jgi:hypothetical protein
VPLNSALGLAWAGHDEQACDSMDMSLSKYFHACWFKRAANMETFCEVGDSLIALKICKHCASNLLQGANLFQESRNPSTLTGQQNKKLFDLHYRLTTHMHSPSMDRWFPLEFHFVKIVTQRLQHDLRMAEAIFARARSELIELVT